MNTKAMSLDETIDALAFYNGKFPRAAIEQAIKKKELITPRLLQVVKDVTEDIQIVENDTEYMLHIYALYLLAQFREVKAYPQIIEFFSIPGDITLELTGDVVTEDLGRILASTFDGNVDLLKRLIEDTEVNEYVRSASLEALFILWGYEKISRQQIIGYFHFLFSEKLVGEISYVWSSLVMKSLRLSPNELEADIEKAFAQGLVETFSVGRDSFEESLGLSNEEALANFRKDSRYKFIENTIYEMENWACFESERKRRSNSVRVNPHKAQHKVGRNEPCTCGSGKKYKKCCYLVNK